MKNQIMGNAVGGLRCEDTPENANSQIFPQKIPSIYREAKAAATKETPGKECEPCGLLTAQTAMEAINEAIRMPDPRYLYRDIVQEGEFIILFADTGIGKTVFSFQSAIEIAERGIEVLYLDLELSKKQFQRRYTDEYGQPFIFPETLYRGEYSRIRAATNGDYTELFIDSLRNLLNETGAKVIFVDNLTKLSSGSTDTAKETIPILNALNEIQAEYELTLFVIEHNKKVDSSRPIALTDLQGSKMKSNLCDTVLSIGRSATDNRIRYLKQLKVRDGEHRYTTENVLTFEITKEGGYLHFKETGEASEYDLLREPTAIQRNEQKEAAREMWEQGESNRSIARQFGITEAAVRKWRKGTPS